MRKANVVLAALMLAFASEAAAQGAADAKKKPADAGAQDAAETRKKSADVPAASAESAGPDTTTETFGDWSIVCAARPGGAERSCEVSTAIMLRNQAAPFARVAAVRAAKDKPVHLFSLVPVNVTVQAPVKITIDKIEIGLPLRSCVPGGCLADIELSRDQLQALRSPAKGPAQLTVVDASGKAASLSFSLRGLDAALDAYLKQQDK